MGLLAAALGLAACNQSGGTPSVAAAAFNGTISSSPRPLAGARLGDPIPGLTASELAAFQRGEVLFEKRFTPEEGLGPLYNATACSSCHSTPVTGGASQLYRNFYIAMSGTAPFMQALPPLPSPIVPEYGPPVFGGSPFFSLEAGRFPIPASTIAGPTTVAQRNSIPVFGVGLFEFVSDATILANSDPFDANGDGISGRPNYDFGSIGRFGVKAQSNNIERFTRPPLFNQMGVTSDPFLGSAGAISLSSLAAQGTVNPDQPIVDNDPVPDPEISRSDLGDLIAYSRFLAPPARLPFDTEAQQGEALFHQLGCALCHIPTLASSRGPVEAFSDLLVHDMGPALADNLQFGAPAPGSASTASEFRTQPLWGVSLMGPFLHDGRAETLFDAVDAHGGEAQASRDGFIALASAEQQAVISFLEHL